MKVFSRGSSEAYFVTLICHISYVLRFTNQPCEKKDEVCRVKIEDPSNELL
jgi:hypothetical protein